MTRQKNRCGCFRQDLTGLATPTPIQLPGGHMAVQMHFCKVCAGL